MDDSIVLQTKSDDVSSCGSIFDWTKKNSCISSEKQGEERERERIYMLLVVCVCVCDVVALREIFK